jgi:signal transduction histidine kinase
LVAGGEPNPPESAQGGYVCISVIDTGIGMPPHVLARAGEPFFTTKSRGRGTGLGLSGARAFAERSGGWLSIESATGHGTTVALWLPVVAPCRGVETEPAEPVV